jgi:hypothetical protein
MRSRRGDEVRFSRRRIGRGWACLGIAVGIGIASSSLRLVAQNAVNPSAAVTEEFEHRVAEYIKLRKSADATLSPLRKPTDSPEKLRQHQRELRNAVVARRPAAAQGNIFTPQISAEFRRLIGLAYHADAKHIRESLLHAEPGTGELQVRVNQEYPDAKPLQSMPPTLLGNLPQLPPGLEYRTVGRELVLRDVDANLIVDVVAGVIPE